MDVGVPVEDRTPHPSPFSWFDPPYLYTGRGRKSSRVLWEVGSDDLKDRRVVVYDSSLETRSPGLTGRRGGYEV